MKLATPHTLGHSPETHLLQSGYDIRTVQKVSGHADEAATMIHAHVLNVGGAGVLSPSDFLQVKCRIAVVGDRQLVAGSVM